MTAPVVIIGAGIVGASISYELAMRDIPVIVLDQGIPGSGASARSFGWINASFAETQGYYRLRRAAIDAYANLSARVPGLGLTWKGSLWWEEEGPALDAQAAQLASLGYEAEILERDAFTALEPAVALPPPRCIHARIEGAADGAAVARALLQAAAGRGAKIVAGCQVTDFMRAGDRITGVATRHGDIPATQVVAALGADAAGLLAKAGVHLPMANKAGLILHTRPVAPTIGHVILSPDIHFRQATDGRIIAGEQFSGDGPGAARIASDPAGLAADLLARLQRRLPTLTLQTEAVMLGTRPVPGDGLPAIGPAKAAPGLYIATMHSGITLAPLVGRLVAGEIAGEGAASLLADFRPERFD